MNDDTIFSCIASICDRVSRPRMAYGLRPRDRQHSRKNKCIIYEKITLNSIQSQYVLDDLCVLLSSARDWAEARLDHRPPAPPRQQLSQVNRDIEQECFALFSA